MNERILFTPKKGKPRKGTIAPGFHDDGMVKVLLDGDPFPVDVSESQVSGLQERSETGKLNKKVPRDGAERPRKKEKMSTTTTKPSAKELRKQAQALGIKGWEDMDRKQMAKAIRKAKATESSAPEDRPRKKAKAPKSKPVEKPAAKATKKAPAKKAVNGTKAKGKATAETSTDAQGLTFAKGSTPKALPDEGVNPFRKSSNLFIVANLLLKGGVRRTLAEKLAAKVDLHPYHKDAETVDLLDYDKRLLLGAQTMRDQFGYGIQRQGRGIDGKILVFRPGGDKDPRGKSAGQKASKSGKVKAAGKAKSKR